MKAMLPLDFSFSQIVFLNIELIERVKQAELYGVKFSTLILIRNYV